MNLNHFPLLLLLCIAARVASAQPYKHTAGEFEWHYNRAMAFSNISLYAPCLEELNLAIESATRNRQEKQRINAIISLAEVMRKTHDFDKGLNLLMNLHIPPTLPELQVRKFGRIAAIYNEWLPATDIDQVKLVTAYLDSALRMATHSNMKQEQAALYNELGYTISSKDRNAGMAYLLRSASLYASLRDTQNYAGAMTNALRNYIAFKDTAKARAVIKEILVLVQGRNWYTAEVELYKQVADYSRLLNDPLSASRWTTMADKSEISNLYAINTMQMNAFRTLYETKKLKQQVVEMETETRLKQEALDRQARRTKELFVYLSLMAMLVVIVIFLLLREKKLRHNLHATNNELQVSNEKYSMLMVESNHRIKNNLQMVISMMQYNEGESRDEVAEAFKRMAGKIQTIAALHKHLLTDVRNEIVAMDTYFKEIVALYQDMVPMETSITSHIAPVKIRSERLVYFGLILNEMIANTIAHSNRSKIETSISVRSLAGSYIFDYDDGSRHELTVPKGTGSSLIRALVQRVGGSDFRFEPSSGHYQFVFHE